LNGEGNIVRLAWRRALPGAWVCAAWSACGSSTPATSSAGRAGGAAATDAAGETGGTSGADAATHPRDAGTRPDAVSDSRVDVATPPLAKLNFFYLDVTGGRVLTANADNPVARVLVPSTGQGPDGVAVDVARGIHLLDRDGRPLGQ
jgi:hypothetical protein